jgi:hypothetical protein
MMMTTGSVTEVQKGQPRKPAACSGGIGRGWNPFGGQKAGQSAPRHEGIRKFHTKLSRAMLGG